MSTLACRSFHARYVLPRSEQGTRERLDRVLADALGAPLERALARRGLRSDEEICVRDVEARVRLRLAATDGALAERWSAAVADAIADVVECGGPGVVRYASRRQALLDLVLGAAEGELERAWAWRRLGLWGTAAADDWTGGEGASAELPRRVTEALLAEPGGAVAVLAAAAARGALPGLLQLLPPESWRALASACDAFHRSAPSRGDGTAGEAQHPRARAAALRIARTSALARAAAAAWPLPGGAAVARAIAGLAVLEAEPGLASAPAERDATAAALAELLATGGKARPEAPGALAGNRAEADDGAALPGGAEPAAGRTAGGGTAQAQAAGSAGPVAELARDDTASLGGTGTAASAAGPFDGQAEGSSGAGATDLQAEPSSPRSREPAPGEPAAVPQRARDVTHWGALLFLLTLLDELGLPEELRLAEQLAHRSLRWSLHRLALLLAPLEAEDPAALAFAGLAPDAAPPSEGEPAPAPVELDALDSAAARVVALLRARLEAPPEEPDGELVERVCRRAAEVVADPGWLELHFSADDADTELRRALLDLDPGWLPWLGCVVRFRYV